MTTTDERAAGRAEERERFAAIINAEGIVGNAARLHSAINLACGSGEMTADAIVGFVTANVPEGRTPGLSLSEREHPANALGLAPASDAAQGAATAERVTAGWNKARAKLGLDPIGQRTA
jgi:hypothetical protein